MLIYPSFHFAAIKVIKFVLAHNLKPEYRVASVHTYNVFVDDLLDNAFHLIPNITYFLTKSDKCYAEGK